MGSVVLDAIPIWAIASLKRAVFKVNGYPTFAKDAFIAVTQKGRNIYEVRIEDNVVTIIPPSAKQERQVDISNIVKALVAILAYSKSSQKIIVRTRDNKYRIKVTVHISNEYSKADVWGTVNIVKGEKVEKPEWVMKVISKNFVGDNLVIVEYDNDGSVNAVAIRLGLLIRHRSSSKNFEIKVADFPVRLERELLAELAKHTGSLEMGIVQGKGVSWETIRTALQIVEDALTHVAGAVLAESL